MSFLSAFWDILNSPPGEAIEKIYHSPSKQWVAQFAPLKSAPKLLTVKQTPIQPNQHYITVTAQKTVLPYDRVLLKTFYGVVHSTIIVHDDDGEPRSLTTFAGLDPALTAIDKRAGEKMVQGARTLLEFAPFRGSAIGSTIALLAVEAANYAKPLLSTLQKMSAIGGAAFFSTGSALAEPLISGIQALSEVAGGSGTQVVYAGNLPLHTGIFLIAAVNAAEFDWSNYSFAADYTLLHQGEPVTEFAYIVVTIEAADSRPNWRQIPALRDAEKDLDAAVKAAGRKIAVNTSEERAKVDNALLAFQWVCLNTPDLCPQDAGNVADMVGARIAGFIQRAGTGLAPAAAGKSYGAPSEPGFSLEDVEPFPRP